MQTVNQTAKVTASKRSSKTIGRIIGAGAIALTIGMAAADSYCYNGRGRGYVAEKADWAVKVFQDALTVAMG